MAESPVVGPAVGGAPEALLAATTFGDPAADDPVVLLHGMLASSEYWRDVVSCIPDRPIIALDLLGFGSSPRPRTSDYGYDDHCGAILETLETLGVRKPVTLVGHSMGALLALRLAAEWPGMVRRLLLVGMPIFSDPGVARTSIGSSWARRRLLYGRTSQLFCTVWCQALKPLSRRVAPLYVRDLPAAVAQATVDHSWISYSRSLENIVERQAVAKDLLSIDTPTLVVHGDEDRDAMLPSELSGLDHVRTVLMEGGHQLPAQRPLDLARLILDGPAASQR